MSGRIFIVDDDREMCRLLDADLRRRGFTTEWRTSAEEALRSIVDSSIDAVLADLNLPGMSGIELCQRLAANRPDVPVVVITAFGSMDAAIAAIRAGAYDFVTKPIEMEMLVVALNRAVRHHALQEKVNTLSQTIERSKRYDELVGSSPPMLKVYDQLERIGDSDASVLITGESGTGKELVAKALHRQSRRRSHPFVAVNCAALPEALLESELFGHTQGAFTDARSARKGLFLQADGGTLLLDEVGDIPMSLQPKLLRALEQRVVRPVGADAEAPFDVRLISATHRDLESAIEEGRFRSDLFFRINVIQIDLPPLRARGTDILVLARHFLEEFRDRSGKPIEGLTETVAERLLNYPWPGNVRELRNAIERAVALTRHDKLVVDDLPDRCRGYESSHIIVGSNNPTELLPMDEVERRYILHVLASVGGNKSLAARVLGLDRKTLYRKLERYEAHGP